MVDFLEKKFEFTTYLSMEECVARLKAKSTRRKRLIASNNEILVRILDEGSGKAFKLDRDWGQNLYAEVHGQLKKNPDGTIYVSGFGRVALITYVLTIGFSLGLIFIISRLPELARFGHLMILVFMIMLLITFIVRDNLVTLVKQTLEANEAIV